MSIVFTIADASGSSSESSVVNQVRQRMNDLDLEITYTTRTPRIAEGSESEFVFMSRESFEAMIARDELLEYTSALGIYYGTPSHALRKAKEKGNDLLIRVDESGVAQIKQKIPGAVSTLIMPGQLAQGRNTAGSTNERSLAVRFWQESSRSRTRNPDQYDYAIVDNSPEDSANRLIEIIRSERLKRS